MIGYVRSLCMNPVIVNKLQNNILKFQNIHLSAPLSLKEFREVRDGKQLTIEAEIVPSPRIPHMLKTEHDCTACPLCRLDLDLKHTDVLILSQFLRSDGLLLPQRVTGLCRPQQKRLTKLVSMAHIAGLMPNLVPSYSKPNCFKKRRGWKRYNTYFDENTIQIYDKFYSDKDETKIKYYLERGLIKKDGHIYSPVVDYSEGYVRKPIGTKTKDLRTSKPRDW